MRTNLLSELIEPPRLALIVQALAIAGLYRQYELYYVIGDERDVVRLRTNFRREAVYLYHLIPATPERSRQSHSRIESAKDHPTSILS